MISGYNGDPRVKMFVDVGTVYLHRDPVDFRKSINGLSLIEAMNLSIYDPALFVFCNKRRGKLKILYWDKNGFCFWHKRLEKETFIGRKSIAKRS